LGLNRGIDDHPWQLGRLDRLGPAGHRQALLEQRLQPLLSHAVAPARHRRAIEHQPMLEELLAAEILVIGVLDPALAQHLIGQRKLDPELGRQGSNGVGSCRRIEISAKFFNVIIEVDPEALARHEHRSGRNSPASHSPTGWGSQGLAI
jgi:hypothetical protein